MASDDPPAWSRKKVVMFKKIIIIKLLSRAGSGEDHFDPLPLLGCEALTQS
jgi:hypothetical protein